MRYVVLTALGLLSWSWAQQYVSPRQTRVFKRNSAIEAITRNAQWVHINLDEGAPPPSRPQRRITDFGAYLGFLKHSQDADTVPITSNTQPDFAGDTLLANNAGDDIDPSISSACSHSFFDSLAVRGAWLVYSNQAIPFFGNYLHGSGSRDTVFYLGGGIAERYDITPPAGGAVYIKGVATQILNNFNIRSNTSVVCNPTTGEVTNGAGSPWDNDGAYTIAYQLLDTVQIIYEVDPGDFRTGSYPNNLIVQVTKPLNQVRIGYNTATGQCVAQTLPVRYERFDYAYFTTPVQVNRDTSLYVAVRYDLYVPGVDNLADTLFGLIGPAYSTGDPCLTADTVNPGRNMVLTPGYRQSTSTFIYPNDWYPQYFLFSGRGYDLNFLLFPIIYAQGLLSSLAPVVQNGLASFSAPYPNPAVDCVHLNVEVPAATTLQLHLYTAEGRWVRSWNRQIASGTSTVAVDLDVPAGAYILQAQSPYGTATFWVNIVK